MSDHRRLVGSGEAARQLGVHYSAISRWVREGKITPTTLTPGEQYRWDMDELRRQLQANAEDMALQPLRAAHSSVLKAIEDTEDPHQAVALAGKVLATLEHMTDDVNRERTQLVARIYRDEASALEPLAGEVEISAARAARRQEDQP